MNIKTLLTDEEIDRLGEGILSLKYHSGSLEWQSYRKVKEAQDAETKRVIVEYLERNLTGYKHLTVENLLDSTFWLEFKKWAG